MGIRRRRSRQSKRAVKSKKIYFFESDLIPLRKIMNYITTIQFNHVLYDIGENIFDLLSNKDLKNCREVCKDWRAAIDGEKYLWHRMTKVHNGKFSLWSEVLMNCNKKTTKELALATREYYFKFIRDENENELALVTPRSQLHFAIWLGNKDVFQTIWDKIGAKDKTEPDETDMVPLQYAAEYGDCEIFKTIYENSVDKDPRGRYGYSLLHHAADNGRFEIIDEILKKDYIEDKNPEDRFGRTALHIAARQFVKSSLKWPRTRVPKIIMDEFLFIWRLEKDICLFVNCFWTRLRTKIPKMIKM